MAGLEGASRQIWHDSTADSCSAFSAQRQPFALLYRLLLTTLHLTSGPPIRPQFEHDKNLNRTTGTVPSWSMSITQTRTGLLGAALILNYGASWRAPSHNVICFQSKRNRTTYENLLAIIIVIDALWLVRTALRRSQYLKQMFGLQLSIMLPVQRQYCNILFMQSAVDQLALCMHPGSAMKIIAIVRYRSLSLAQSDATTSHNSAQSQIRRRPAQ